MTIFALLRASNKTHWLDAFYWFILIVGLSTLPLWGTWLIFLLQKKPIVIADLMVHGEFYIYSAALVAESLYTLMAIKYRINIGIILSIFLIIVCVLFFASVTISQKAQQEITSGALKEFETIDIEFLKQTSIFIFSLVLVISFTTKLIDNIKTNPPVRGFRDNAYEDLETDFESTSQ